MLPRQQRRLDPFGKLGRALEPGQRQLAHALVRNAFGQRIDRLADGDVAGGGGLEHLGMDDLPLVAPRIEPPADDARLAQRELLLAPTPDC